MGAITRTFANQIKTGGKLDADGLDLTDTFSFTGTVTGAGEITEADQWYLNTNFTSSGVTPITANWSRSSYGTGTLPLGTGMSESSGIFSFPSTGYWMIHAQSSMTKDSTSYYCGIIIEGTSNNSTYIRISENNDETTSQASSHANASSKALKKVTDTSNDKIRMSIQAQASTVFVGNANYMATGLIFIKLGEI